MFVPDSQLSLEVATRNIVNAKANELRLVLQDVLKPFIGKKIIKVTPYRTLTKQVSAVIDPICEIPGFRFRVDSSYQYSLTGCIDKTYPINDCSVQYVKQEFYIASIKDCVLVGADKKWEEFRTDYTVEEIIAARADIRSLEGRVSALKSLIREFQ